MKKVFRFLLIFVFGLSNQGFSQTFNFYNTSDTLTHANSIWISVYSTGIIQNLSATKPLTLDVIRLQNDHSPPWFSAICTDFCYPITIDSTILVLGPGQSQLFKNYFAFIQHSSDTAHTRILFSDHMNPVNYFIHDYYCVDDSSNYYVGLPENENTDHLEIFPNPFSSETNLSFPEYLKDATLEIYNSSGQEVRKIPNVNGQYFKLYRDNLPNGLYYIRLIVGDKSTTKIVTLND